MPPTAKKRVLFLCTGNSARSQMAEAMLRALAGDRFVAVSAGTQPTEVDSRTLQALRKAAIPAEHLHAKAIEAVCDQHFDFVITLCDKAHQECRRWPGSGVVMAWDFPDPKASEDPQAFDKILAVIRERLIQFVNVNDKRIAHGIQTVSALDFYKALADETRLICLLLIEQQEYCVCELVEALQLSQPKISRHLAQLRKGGLLMDRRQGQWVYYRLHPLLNDWMRQVLRETRLHSATLLNEPLQRLAALQAVGNTDTGSRTTLWRVQS